MQTAEFEMRSPARSAVPRVAVLWRSEIVAAVGLLGTRLGAAAPDDKSVHEMRRAAKKLRALALLAPDSLGVLATETRRHADALRRALGSARDDAVRRQTFDRLARRGDATIADLGAIIEVRHADATAPEVPERLPADIAALGRDWTLCDIASVRDDRLVLALAQTYRRARKRRKAARTGETKATHRWRRAIVDLDLQLGLFASKAPPLRRTARRADRMRELLGRLHDVDALVSFVKHAPDASVTALAALDRSAASERARLLRTIRHRAKQLFATKTGCWREDVDAVLYAGLRTAEAAAGPGPDGLVGAR